MTRAGAGTNTPRRDDAAGRSTVAVVWAGTADDITRRQGTSTRHSETKADSRERERQMEGDDHGQCSTSMMVAE
jgi:hypothetical protein